MNYYNEFDPKTAAWLRELIAQKLIPAGDVDTRSIVDVCPDDLRAYTQCHFFAGIGGWSLALQLAGWPADKPIWTGSCPCQPFSTAGKQLGDKDERHLWPVFFNLIKECRPEYVFGEQVASAIGKGWLDGVSSDLGEEGYTCGSAVLGAHSVGAPHIRQRLYWVAYSELQHERSTGSHETRQGDTVGVREASGMGNSIMPRCEARDSIASGDESRPEQSQDSGAWSNNGLGNTIDTGLQGHGRPIQQHDTQGREGAERHSATAGFWSDYTIIPCRDGKARRIPAQAIIEPVLQHVVDGLSCSLDARRNILSAAQGFPLTETIQGRVALLKGAGNAIVPQVAAEFIQAFNEVALQ